MESIYISIPFKVHRKFDLHQKRSYWEILLLGLHLHATVTLK